MTEETAGQRLQTLRGEITQLTARAEQLADAIGAEPAPPPPASSGGCKPTWPTS